MLIIKLDAIDSTNDYLKALAKEKSLENFTTVIADKQLKGKGQMGSEWVSEAGKNLTMSVLVKSGFEINHTIFDINVAVALSIISVLDFLNIPKVSVKWPNDIMAENKKLGGILIENAIKSDGTVSSVIGIGLNSNQSDFLNLPKATSLFVETQQEFDKEMLMNKIVEKLQEYIQMLPTHSDNLWETYHNRLFKKGIPMPFELADDVKIMGIIQKVSREGMLELLLDDDSIQYFGVKDIKMLY